MNDNQARADRADRIAPAERPRLPVSSRERIREPTLPSHVALGRVG